jgi:uncharacterized membrane protein
MESNQRSLIKTFTYRVAALAATVPFTGFGTAIGIHLVLMGIYYVHERIWNRIDWGSTK